MQVERVLNGIMPESHVHKDASKVYDLLQQSRVEITTLRKSQRNEPKFLYARISTACVDPL